VRSSAGSPAPRLSRSCASSGLGRWLADHHADRFEAHETVEDRGFFLYCNGRDAESFDGKLGFLISLLPYTGNSEWVEPTLLELKACLMHDEAPSASAGCEFCGYIAATHKVENGRIATPPRRPISNRHPADQIADVRQQITVLKKQETDLREILINATELDRVGDDWIAKVSEQKGACLIVRR
jgi:hypothetical protein